MAVERQLNISSDEWRQLVYPLALAYVARGNSLEEGVTQAVHELFDRVPLVFNDPRTHVGRQPDGSFLVQFKGP